jgi:hypothetical protein
MGGREPPVGRPAAKRGCGCRADERVEKVTLARRLLRTCPYVCVTGGNRRSQTLRGRYFESGEGGNETTGRLSSF